MGIDVSAMQFYEEHPVEFIRDIIGVDFDPWQRDACDALLKHKFLAIRSGHGVGKTCFLACVLLWFISTKPNCRIPTTAPTQHQLFDLLWAECYKRIKGSPYLDALLNWTGTRIGVKGHEPDWYAVARTATVSPETDTAEGLAGFHADDNLLFIIDEGSAVPDAVYAAVEGAFTGPNSFCIIASNPTRLNGYYFDVFHLPKLDKFYHKIHVSCYDSPRVSPRYIQMMEDKYGENHPLFQIKVLGNFPDAEESLLIPPEFVDAMLNSSRDGNVSPKMHVEMGVDLGYAKGSTTCCVRQGFNVLEFVEKKRISGVYETQEIVKWISNLMHDHNPHVARIDGCGIGKPICDLLEPIFGDTIVRVIGQARAADNDVFLNMRAEGYWHIRDILPKLYCANWPDRLITELGDIRRRFSTKGKLHVETKEEMRARALRSPDFADALMYAFLEAADGEPTPMQYSMPKCFGAVNSSLSRGVSTWNVLSASSNAPHNGWKHTMKANETRYASMRRRH